MCAVGNIDGDIEVGPARLDNDEGAATCLREAMLWLRGGDEESTLGSEELLRGGNTMREIQMV